MGIIFAEYIESKNKLKLSLIDDVNNDTNLYFYSIYGNMGYSLKGIFNIGDGTEAPTILIDVGDNYIFFIKIKKKYMNDYCIETKFIEVDKLRCNININMRIVDKVTDGLFRSINLDEIMDLSEDSEASEASEDSEDSEDSNNGDDGSANSDDSSSDTNRYLDVDTGINTD